MPGRESAAGCHEIGRLGRRATARLILAVVLASACADIPSGPDEPFSLAFDPLPYPAVVRGDTLRDSSGVATPLSATGFNAAGAPVDGAPIIFVALDSGVTVDTLTGWVVAGDSPRASVRLAALLGRIPSVPASLAVVARPDSLALDADVPTEVVFDYATATDIERFTVTSDAVTAQVLHFPDTTVASWLVNFGLEYHGETLAAGDSSRGVWLVDGGGRGLGASVDTTDASGNAERQLRVRPAALANASASAADSVTVVITASHRGLPLAGSPRRVQLLIRPAD